MRRAFALLTVATVLALVGGIVVAAPALAAPIKISEDPYTNSDSQHKTQVEPDSYAFGRTIVTLFQSGRYFSGGGASNNGWATSTDAGATWSHGFLPGTTPNSTPPGPWDRATDPSVVYDAKHQVWLANSLALKIATQVNDVIVNRSPDGLAWGNPVVVAAGDAISYYDKNWITCDNTQSSPFFGNCYIEWDDNGRGNLMLMSTSTNGGLTWGPPKQTANHETGGLGGQPVVLSNGNVVVPFLGNSGIKSFMSTDGGNTWSTPILIASAIFHTPAGGIRAGIPLPSAEVRNPGIVVVTWPDCRFEPGCNANDIVMSTSGNGTNWSAVQRIPLDPVGSGVDHFLPGIALQPQGTTNSTLIHMALGYYYYPVSACNSSTCQLNAAFSFSIGGLSWSPPQQLAGPMQLSWLASTNQGRMVGDYMSTSYVGNNAFPVFASATAPIGGVFQEHMYTSQQAASGSVDEMRSIRRDPVLASKAELAAHQWRGSRLPTAR
jgi:hypothetical protein